MTMKSTLAAPMTALAVIGLMTISPSSASAAEAARPGRPACPLIFGHGGYPSGPNAWAKDQVRQPNNPSAVRDQKTWGVHGVEGDVQLTKHGTKAVMWHNTSTNGLTGPKRNITDIWWTAGSDNLRDRRIARGPYRGERVYSLRQWLDYVRSQRLIALVEVKPETKRVLSDPVYGTRAWKEIIDPIRERRGIQRIMVYSQDPWIEGQLARHLPGLLKGSAARWTDSVPWDEPPRSWTGNVRQWRAVLNQRPKSVMTNYPKQYRAWLAGKCR